MRHPAALLAIVALATFALARSEPARAQSEEPAYLHASPEDMEWWRDARFGLFVHWGPVSLKGAEIGWSRGGERRGTGGTGEIPVTEYDSLYKRFNPTDFDADEWVAIAKAAGMRYIVFTTKHHDGFCMFRSALTDHSITNSPFGRDVTRELAAACNRAGMRVGWYYSPPDWHHPDYRTANHAAYVEYLHGQLREICSNYGKIDIIWFDGLGGTAEDWDSRRLFRMIRHLQPHVVINNRAGLPADFDTPEQTIGRYQTNRPWESCITICRQWAWKPNDDMKSLDECIGTLVRCAGGDGNLLFNVGPMPTGAIEPRQAARLREMGDWLEKYGESIYGTRGGPFRPDTWGASTCAANRVYVHILDPSVRTVRLPGISARIVRARLLTGGSAQVRQTRDRIEIEVDADARTGPDTIVALYLDRPAEQVREGRPASGSMVLGRSATASNTYQGLTEDYGPQRAFDGDPETRWATDGGVHAAWLEVPVAGPRPVGRVRLSEAFDRVRSFEIQAREHGGWRTIHQGATIGENLTVEFPPLRTDALRLRILEATDGPTLWEWKVSPPGR